jgi:glycosyltransferase involved in cell wall biosynthesis
VSRRPIFAVPGDLSAPTGGYEYARRVLRALPDLAYLALPGGFPDPSVAALAEAAASLRAVPTDAVLLIDGLALGAMPVGCLEGVPAPVVALVHHPLFLESGLSDARRSALRGSEQAALALVAHVITTSADTAAMVSEAFGVPGDRVSVAEPGTDAAARAVVSGMPPLLLAVGSVLPRKGFDLLVEALGGLVDLDWTLVIVGALDRDAEAVAALRASIVARGLAGRVTLAGAVDRVRLDGLYAAADLFVISSLYEGYGMAAAEALARGLPMVASTGGALATTVPDAAALRFAPGDVAGMRAALRLMLRDPARRAACADASWAAGQRLQRWSDTGRRIAAVLSSVGGKSAE